MRYTIRIGHLLLQASACTEAPRGQASWLLTWIS